MYCAGTCFARWPKKNRDGAYQRESDALSHKMRGARVSGRRFCVVAGCVQQVRNYTQWLLQHEARAWQPGMGSTTTLLAPALGKVNKMKRQGQGSNLAPTQNPCSLQFDPAHLFLAASPTQNFQLQQLNKELSLRLRTELMVRAMETMRKIHQQSYRAQLQLGMTGDASDQVKSSTYVRSLGLNISYLLTAIPCSYRVEMIISSACAVCHGNAPTG